MKRAQYALLCLTLLLLAGCTTPPPDVMTTYHPADGLRTDLIVDNLLEGGETPREMLWLNASRVFKSARKYSYYLEVTYAARAETGYLDITPGPSLLLVVDGKELTFLGVGSQHLRKNKGGLLNESALYEVKANDLRTIAAGQRVTVSVMGQNGTVRREFKPVNSERFRKFVKLFVKEK